MSVLIAMDVVAKDDGVGSPWRPKGPVMAWQGKSWQVKDL